MLFQDVSELKNVHAQTIEKALQYLYNITTIHNNR